MAKNDELKVLVIGIVNDQVKLLLIEALKGLMTEDKVKVLVDESYEATVALVGEAIKVIPNEDRIKELIAAEGFVTEDALHEILLGVSPQFGVSLAAVETVSGTPPLDPAWLEGLTFKGAKQEKVKEPGQRPKMVSKPYERPLTHEDILSHSVGEDTVTLVTADGKKHTVDI